MPIIKAAIKHLRQSEKRRKVNRALKEKVKSAIKEMVKLSRDKKYDEMQKKLSSAYSIIDKAAKCHIIHKNNASRKKSRIAHLLKPAK